MSNSDSSILAAPLALIASVPNYDCSYTVNAQQSSLAVSNSWTLALANPVNISDVRTISILSHIFSRFWNGNVLNAVCLSSRSTPRPHFQLRRLGLPTLPRPPPLHLVPLLEPSLAPPRHQLQPRLGLLLPITSPSA